jgi:hypothetical protein
MPATQTTKRTVLPQEMLRAAGEQTKKPRQNELIIRRRRRAFVQNKAAALRKRFF